MKIFVGNLSDEATEDDLYRAFEGFGQVRSVTIVMDEATHKSRGFAFVVMSSVDEAQNAIKKMDGKDFRGKKISVEKSRTNTKVRASRRKRSRLRGKSHAGESRRGKSGGCQTRRRH